MHFNGPLVLDEYCMYTFHNDSLASRNKADGSIIWSTFIDDLDLVRGYTNHIAVDNSHVCLAIGGNSDTVAELRTFDKTDGSLLWHYDFPVWMLTEPLIANDVVYVINDELWAFDVNTGDSLFCSQESGTLRLTQPALTNHRLFVATHDKIFAMDHRIVNAIQDNEPVVMDYRLYSNYPNPFNPETTISFQIPQKSHVELQVYDVTGRLVRTLIDGEMRTGVHQVQFNGEGLASGIYFYRLTANDYKAYGKMLFVK